MQGRTAPDSVLRTSYPSNKPGHSRPGDAEVGIEATDDFERFTQRNDVFSRAMWDETVRSKHTDGFFNSYRMQATPRRGNGFSQRDFALRNAAWRISDVMTDRYAAEGRREGFQAPISNDTPVAPQKAEIDNPTAMAQEIKRVAQLFWCGSLRRDRP